MRERLQIVTNRLKRPAGAPRWTPHWAWIPAAALLTYTQWTRHGTVEAPGAPPPAEHDD